MSVRTVKTPWGVYELDLMDLKEIRDWYAAFPPELPYQVPGKKVGSYGADTCLIARPIMNDSSRNTRASRLSRSSRRWKRRR